MLKENQKINIPWTQTAQSYFGKLGYKLSKGSSIWVKPEELPKGSHRRVKVICDKCGKELEMEYRQYINKRKKFDGKYYCRCCGSGMDQTKEKRIKTCMEKYGVDNPMHHKEFQEKIMHALCENSSVPTSQQQIKVYEMLKTKYKTTLNFPFSNTSLDCLVEANEEKIDVEYDGWYWHQDPIKDIKRDRFLQNNGYKVLRIKSGKNIPTQQQLDRAIQTLIKSDLKYYEIILEDYKEKGKEITN